MKAILDLKAFGDTCCLMRGCENLKELSFEKISLRLSLKPEKWYSEKNFLHNGMLTIFFSNGGGKKETKHLLELQDPFGIKSKKRNLQMRPDGLRLNCKLRLCAFQ